MRFASLLPNVESDIPGAILQCQAEVPARAVTSTVRYPKKRDHYIPNPINPSVRGYRPCLLLQTNIDGKAQNECPSVIAHRLLR